MVTPTASENDKYKKFKFDLKDGDDLWFKRVFSSFDGATPVHVAAAWGKGEELDMLLSKGGDPMIKDNEGLTALDYAKNENQQEVLLKLQSYQGNIYPDLEEAQNYTYELGIESKIYIICCALKLCINF